MADWFPGDKGGQTNKWKNWTCVPYSLTMNGIQPCATTLCGKDSTTPSSTVEGVVVISSFRVSIIVGQISGFQAGGGAFQKVSENIKNLMTND